MYKNEARASTNHTDFEEISQMLMKPNQYDAQVEQIREASTEAQLGVIGRAAQKVEAYVARRRERRELLSLDDRMLNDIGLNRADADRIAGAPFKWTGKNGAL
jgi:uncharacterized protein YjiS (DUF1127 family)